MTAPGITIEQLRADIAGILEEAPAIDDNASLLDNGLDSMRAMNLAMLWEEKGVPLDFTDLAETSTIAELWAVLRPRLEGGAA